ncbi:MAG: hypothetical protein JST50_16820 [Bacteroidetes bacterium]|jgi:hypothetical protein|nr:hypothetical protein [Bacteroidota bacterium]
MKPGPICTIALLLMCLMQAHSQTITAAELVKLTRLSVKESNSFLTKKKLFAQLSVTVKKGVTTTSYMKNAGIWGAELIFVRRAGDRSNHSTIEYQIDQNSYIDVIKKQLLQAGFTLKPDPDKKPGKTWDSWEYVNKTYSVGILKMPNGLPTSIYVVDR